LNPSASTKGSRYPEHAEQESRCLRKKSSLDYAMAFSNSMKGKGYGIPTPR